MNLASKRILVTGATGFVGVNLVRRLLESHNKLHILLRPNSNNLWRLRGLSIKNVHELNLLDKKRLMRKISQIKPQIIFHLAAYGSYPGEKDFQRILDINVVSTINLYKACSEAGFEVFVNTGSSSEYGIVDKPMREDMPLAPLTSYGSTKAAATIILAQLAKDNQCTVTLRPFSVYGPFEQRSRLIATLMVGAVLGKEVALASKKSAHDFVFVEDLIDAYLLAAVKRIPGIFNIGTGSEYSNWEVLQIAKRILEGKLSGHWGKQAPRPQEVKHWICDNRRAKKMLGWKPKHNLEQGLLETYKWFGKNINYYL